MTFIAKTNPHATRRIDFVSYANGRWFASPATFYGAPYDSYYSDDSGVTWSVVDDSGATPPSTNSTIKWVVHGGGHYLSMRYNRVAFSTGDMADWADLGTAVPGTYFNPYVHNGTEWMSSPFWNGTTYEVWFATDPGGTWTQVDTTVTQAGLALEVRWYDGKWWMLANGYAWHSTNKTTWTGGAISGGAGCSVLEGSTTPDRLIVTDWNDTLLEWDIPTQAWVALPAPHASVATDGYAFGLLDGEPTSWNWTGEGYTLAGGSWVELPGPVDYTGSGTDSISAVGFASPRIMLFAGTATVALGAWMAGAPLIVETTQHEAAVLNDRTTQVVAQFVREVAILDDGTTNTPYSFAHDVAVLNDAASGFVTVTHNVREAAALHGTTGGFATTTDTVREVAVLDDAPLAGAPAHTVRETAVLDDAVSAVATATQTVREAATLGDRAGAAAFTTVRDIAVLDDGTSDLLRARNTVREIATLDDGTSEALSARDTVRETALFDDASSDSLLARTVTRERAFLSADPVQPRSDTAWTANIQTWAMSRYDHFPYESLTASYAAGADGLHVPGTETVEAGFTTGDCDFGLPTKKALHALYAVGTHDEPLTITVSADVRGQRVSAEYMQMAREADDDRTVRSPVGRGFNSNFYRMAFSSTGNFTVHSGEALVAPSARRI